MARSRGAKVNPPGRENVPSGENGAGEVEFPSEVIEFALVCGRDKTRGAARKAMIGNRPDLAGLSRRRFGRPVSWRERHRRRPERDVRDERQMALDLQLEVA